MAKLGDKIPADPDRAEQNKAEVRARLARNDPDFASAVEDLLAAPHGAELLLPRPHRRVTSPSRASRASR